MEHIYVTQNQSITSVLDNIKKNDLLSSSKDLLPITIHLEKGIFHEKITIDRPYLHFIGEDAKNTVIEFDDYANFIMEDGSKMGTFRSYTVFIDTHNITMENITIANTSAPRKKVGQAIALYADGDELYFKNCRLLGNQDTLFTGPLPPTAYEPNGFVGPKEFAPRIVGKQFYDSCYICGDIDFIFGSATAFFYNCEIETMNNGVSSTDYNGNSICGYITAASTPEDQDFGYLFYKCHLTGSNCPDGSVYLGRPWRNYAKTVFIECEMDSCIHPAGFHDWNKKDAHNTIFYAEYNNYGAGAVLNKRSDFCHILTEDEAHHHMALVNEWIAKYNQ